jgi:diacylglycerol kinase (ATP)
LAREPFRRQWPSLPLKEAVLIYNPVAGGKPSRRERHMLEAVAVLESAGMAARLAPTTAPGTASQLARSAVEQGVRLVFACGGDGTIHEVINGMVPGDAALGILPGGTANILARELRMPLDPLRAARAISRWTPRRIAVGRATWMNGSAGEETPQRSFFLSLAGVGFDAYVIHKLQRHLATRFGVAAYVAGAVRQVFHYSFPLISFRTEDKEVTGAFAVVQRTERYAGWLHLAPGASVFKNQFTLCVLRTPRRSRYLRYALAILAGRHTRMADVELIQTCRVECAAADSLNPIYFELDGELAGCLPATFEIVPDALTVLVP